MVASSTPLLLAALAVALASLVGGIAFIVAERRRSREVEHEADRLRDEVWELREASASRDRAEAANEAKSRFLANVSHEVRTPLNGILGMAELLSGMSLDAEQDTYVAAIRSSGSALASLIEEILDFSKIEAGKVELAPEPFDVVRLVEGVAELLAPRAQGKSLEIATSVAADVPRLVDGDPVRLRQILLNLAGNAVKFTAAGGVGVRVTVADKDAGILRFDVEDTGPGVPIDRRAAVFEDFEQADSKTALRHGGTGLGLAISKGLAERMGGSLSLADGAGGTGSCFTLLLPLATIEEAASAIECPELAGRTALIVGESPFEGPFLAERLAEAGVRVTLLASAEAARTRLEADAPFDVMVVDCALGEAVARTLGEAARRAGAGRTLVLFSPYERRALGQTSVGNFDGWLVKPVRRQTLFALAGSPRTPMIPRRAPRPPVFTISGHLDVLLAEDNEINALLATRHLQRLGANVTRAPDGVSALALAEAALEAGTPFGAMVLDIRMPGLDGLEVARRVRLAESVHGAPPARLVALSADLLVADRRAGATAGIDEFVGKPVSFAQLAQSLGPVLAQPMRQLAEA